MKKLLDITELPSRMKGLREIYLLKKQAMKQNDTIGEKSGVPIVKEQFSG